jgi:hypothetical protein
MNRPLAVLCMIAGPALLLGQTAPAAAPKLSASAIQIELVEVGDISIPAEFRYAIYERLVQQVQQSGIFQKVFRSGDQAAKDIPNLVILHTQVDAFKEGSQMKRELVPVVAGTTTVDITTRLTSADGKTLLDKKIAGKVRIFGENLGATNDLAKRVTKLLRESF